MNKTLSLVSVAVSAAVCALSLSSTVIADELSRPDAHAPAGVMGDHVHSENEWMMSYSYMTMDMAGNLNGTEDIAIADILMPMPGTYMVAPTEMTMGMHMLGAMYAPNDRLTLMFMANFIDTDMDHLTAMGGAFSTSTSGLGDTSIAGLFSLTKAADGSSNSHASLALYLPTGSIDEEDVTPASAPNTTQLPYPMQLGSGSFALEPGYTYNRYLESWSWGAQVKGRFQIERNKRDYSLGDLINVSAWAAKPLNENFSLSARLQWRDWKNIDGADDRLNPAMVPTADPSLREGTRMDLGLGINWITAAGEHSNWRLAAEYLMPVHQDLNGPQLETDSTLILKTQYAF